MMNYAINHKHTKHETALILFKQIVYAFIYVHIFEQ